MDSAPRTVADSAEITVHSGCCVPVERTAAALSAKTFLAASTNSTALGTNAGVAKPAAGAPSQKGRKGIAGGKSKKAFEAERELSRQAEAAYRRLITGWKSSRPGKGGSGATPGRASIQPSKGKAARQATSP